MWYERLKSGKNRKGVENQKKSKKSEKTVRTNLYDF